MAKVAKSLKSHNNNKENGLQLLDACFDDIGYARFLLRNGNKSFNWRDPDTGVSILHSMVYSDASKQIELLLSFGADPDMRNRNKETPLHWCAKLNCKNAAKVLLEHKCDPNSLDNSLSTPLHCAAAAGNLEIVPLLLDHGASVELADNEGLTAVELSAQGKSQSFFAITVLLLRFYQQQGLVAPNHVRLKYKDAVLMDPSVIHAMTRHSKPASLPDPAPVVTSATEPSTTNQPDSAGEISAKIMVAQAPTTLTVPESASPNITSKAESTSPPKSTNSPHKDTKPNSNTSGGEASLTKPPTVEYRSPPASTVLQSSARRHSSVNSSPARELSPNGRRGSSFVVRHVEHKPSSVGISPLDGEPTRVSPSRPRAKTNAPPVDPAAVAAEAVANTASLRRASLMTVNSDVPEPEGEGEAAETASTKTKTVTESLFPPSEVPFKPSMLAPPPSGADKLNPQIRRARIGFDPFRGGNSRFLDVVIAVEHCADCEQHNGVSLRHDPQKYVRVANDILYSSLKDIAQAKFAVRVYAMRVKATSVEKRGALEVTVAVNVTRSAARTMRSSFSDSNLTAPEVKPPEKKKVMRRGSLSVGFKPGGRTAVVGGANVLGKAPSGGRSTLMRSSFAGMPSISGSFDLGAALEHANDPTSTIHGAKEDINSKRRESLPHLGGEDVEGLEDSDEDKQKWVTHKVFSKLDTLSWPSLSLVRTRVISFLATALSEVCDSVELEKELDKEPDAPWDQAGGGWSRPQTKNEGPGDPFFPGDQLPPVPYRHEQFTPSIQSAIEASYKEWVARMRIPPRVERSPLDLDWPTELLHKNIQPKSVTPVGSLKKMASVTELDESSGSSEEEEDSRLKASSGTVAASVAPMEKRLQGPYLEPQLPAEGAFEHEKRVMEHFLVFDLTIKPEKKR